MRQIAYIVVASFLWLGLNPALAGSEPYEPAYGEGPHDDILRAFQLISEVNERCDFEELEDIYQRQTIMERTFLVKRLTCENLSGADYALLSPALAIECWTQLIAIQVPRELDSKLIKACEDHDSMVDNAVLEATYENGVRLLNDLAGLASTSASMGSKLDALALSLADHASELGINDQELATMLADLQANQEAIIALLNDPPSWGKPSGQ